MGLPQRRCDCVPFSGHDVMEHVMSVCVARDVNLDHLANMVSSRILYCKVAFSFIVTEYLVERTGDYANILFLLTLCLLILAHISDSCLWQLLMWCFNGDFLFLPFFSIFINWNFVKK